MVVFETSRCFCHTSCCGIQAHFIMPVAFVLNAPTPRGIPLKSRHAVTSVKRRRSAPKNHLRMTQALKRPPSAVPRPSAATKKPKANPQLAAEGDALESTPYQKALLTAFIATASAHALKVSFLINSPEEALSNIGAVALSYLFTDFATGVYHHAVDNYGSANTPIFGYQIAAFQGHHSFPWTITARDVANNLYRLTYPTLPQLVILMALNLPSVATSFYSSFLCFIVLSQETHRQAHMTRSAPWVRFLQKASLILSKNAHAAHHVAPPKGAFEGNYCILSGVCNPLLDRTRFFRLHEAVVFRLTGTEPISWSLSHQLKKEAIGMLPGWLK